MTQDLDLLTKAGFNTAEAMGRLGGNQKLYLSILSRFQEQYINLPATLNDNLANGKLEDIALQAHTVKGLAGSIGHSELQAAALALEQAAKQNSASIKDILQSFAQVLTKVITALQQPES